MADPEIRFYRAFGLERGSLAQLLGPQVWACGLRASKKGHSVGKPVGDVRMMPGVFLVKDRSIVKKLLPKHAGESIDWTGLAQAARDLVGATS